jgi:hypothetical protein
VGRRYTGCELRYVPETGEFYRVLKSGEIEPAPGYRNKRGYLVIRHEGKIMLAHRRAFYLMTGQCPKIIDHINRDPSDNRWANLREATPALNGHNRLASNATGLKGVWCRKGINGDRYYAQITFEKRTTNLGVYADPQTAARAYDAAARLIYGPQAVTNFAA